MLEFGTVKVFNRRDEERLHGYIVVRDREGRRAGNDLYFRFADGRLIGNDGATPVFRERVNGQESREVLSWPRRDDRLVFRRASNAKGIKAAPWGFAFAWDSMIAWLKKRPVYRLVLHHQGSDTEIWRGQNLYELSATWPKLTKIGKGKNRTVDRLQRVLDSGVYAGEFRFECLNGRGRWEETADPRLMVCCVPQHVFLAFRPPGVGQSRCTHQ